MEPIYHDFKIQVLSALTGTTIVQCCPCQDPDCPMSVSDTVTQSVASPPGAAPALPTCSTPPAAAPALPTCSTPSPATTLDPTTSSRLENLGSNPDYDTFVAVNAALSGATGVAIKNELNKNEIALNDYFIIKPSLLRVPHDSDPYRMMFPNTKHKPGAENSNQQGQKLLLHPRHYENSK